MDPLMLSEPTEVMGKIRYLPAVSIILPFHPVVNKKAALDHNLMLVMQKIEQELLTNYVAEKAVPVLLKLKNVICNLNYTTHRKSIAICVSPVVEKVYYLDMEVSQKIVIDDSFKMRDVVLSKTQIPRYLVMLLRTNSCKLYEGNCSGFKLIKYNISNKTLSKDFLKEMDNGLSVILKAYRFPLFLLGSKTEIEGFEKITANKNDIIQQVEIGSAITEVSEMKNILLPYEVNWESIKQTYLLNQIKKACEDRLFTGIEEVWNKAMQNKGKLLIIEKKYITQKIQSKTPSFNNTSYLIGKPFFIKDEVDEIIGKVFENGGDVEFINEDLLNGYKQIALIEH